MDPLSDILRLTEVSAHLSAGMTGHGRWAVAFAPPVGVKFNFVRRGKCSLRVGDDVVELGEGDCFLLSARLPFVIATDLGALPRPASEVYAVLGEDGMAHVGERIGDDEHESVSLIGGRFDFGARARSVLVDHLPPVMRIDAARPEAAVIRTTLNDIDSEIRAARAGSGIVAESLALVMLAHAVRMYVADSSQNVTGLLAGLRDPVVAAAVSALHRQPAHPWSVAELASVVSVSRSTLAARFVRNVGSGPLAYLTTWRMELAAQQLRRGDDTLEAIAHDVGYGSDSAFSVAFKRVIGSSPNAYRRASASTRTDLPNFSRT